MSAATAVRDALAQSREYTARNVIAAEADGLAPALALEFGDKARRKRW